MLAMSLWLKETVSSMPRESSTPKSSHRSSIVIATRLSFPGCTFDSAEDPPTFPHARVLDEVQPLIENCIIALTTRMAMAQIDL